MDSVTECDLSECADDTKLGGALDTQEGRDDMQMDPDWLERFSCANLMRFTKAKCKVLQLDWGIPKHKYCGEWIESSSKEKDLGCWWMRSSTCAGNVSLQPRKQIYSGLHQRSLAQSLREVILSLSSALGRPLLEYCIQLWGPKLKKDMEVLEGV